MDVNSKEAAEWTDLMRRNSAALEAALRNFADPSNWSDRVGCLQWMGKRHAIEYAQSIIDRVSG